MTGLAPPRTGQALELLIGELLLEELDQARTKVSSRLVEPEPPSITPVSPQQWFDGDGLVEPPEGEPDDDAGPVTAGEPTAPLPVVPEPRPPRPSSPWTPLMAGLAAGAVLASLLWALALGLGREDTSPVVQIVEASAPARAPRPPRDLW